MKKFAFFISRIFDFYFWFPTLLLISLFNTGLGRHQIEILLPTLLVLDVGVPITLFFWILREKVVSDIDVTRREERPKLFGFSALLILGSTYISYLFGNTLFFGLQVTAFFLIFTLFLITLKYKISGHMAMNVSAILIINYLFNWQFLWLFLIVPVVAFARIYLKKHTLGQVVTGSVVGLVEPLLVLRLFGFL